MIEGLDVLSDILASHVDIPDNPLGGAPDPPVVVDSVTIGSYLLPVWSSRIRVGTLV